MSPLLYDNRSGPIPTAFRILNDTYSAVFVFLHRYSPSPYSSFFVISFLCYAHLYAVFSYSHFVVHHQLHKKFIFLKL
jgi:hypothetical protein